MRSRAEQLEARIQTEAALNRLGVLRQRDLLHFGNRGAELEFMRQWRVIVPRGAGLYTARGVEPRDAVLAACRIDQGVLCLHSALHVHGLVGREPEKAWIAIPRTKRRPKPLVCPLEILWCDAEVLQSGAEVMSVDGVPVPVTTITRTLVDCVRFPKKVDVELTRSLLQSVLSFGIVGSDELLEDAARCRARSIIEAELVRIRPELVAILKEQHLDERRMRRRLRRSDDP